MDAPYEHKKAIKKKIRTLGKQYLKKMQVKFCHCPRGRLYCISQKQAISMCKYCKWMEYQETIKGLFINLHLWEYFFRQTKTFLVVLPLYTSIVDFKLKY